MLAANTCVRLTNAVKGGALPGIVLIFLAFALLIWNEAAAVQTAKSLEEGQGAVVSVELSELQFNSSSSSPPSSAPSSSSSLRDRLVHLRAQLIPNERVIDAVLAVQFYAGSAAKQLTAPVIKARRIVEMFQWLEKKEEEPSPTSSPSSTTPPPTIVYKQYSDWSSMRYDSSLYHLQPGSPPLWPPNPSTIPFPSQYLVPFQFWLCTTVDVDACQQQSPHIQLTDVFVGQLADGQPASPDSVSRSNFSSSTLNTSTLARYHVNPYTGYLQSWKSDNPSRFQIGDVRARYSLLFGGLVSVVGRLSWSASGSWQLVPYQTGAGDTINMLARGDKTADQMFQEAVAANVARTWAFRFVGWLLVFLGLRLMAEPVVVFARTMPVFGSCLGQCVAINVTIGALLGSISVTVVIVGLAWVAVRPLLGGLLLLGALVPVILIKVYQMQKKRQQQQQTSGYRLQTHPRSTTHTNYIPLHSVQRSRN